MQRIAGNGFCWLETGVLPKSCLNYSLEYTRLVFFLYKLYLIHFEFQKLGFEHKAYPVLFDMEYFPDFARALSQFD
jgi:hypothetical protein